MIEKILAQPSVLPPINPGDLGGQPWSDPLEIVQFAITKLILPILVGLAVLYVVWSGYQFFSSTGDPERAERARRNLIYSIIGVILVTISYALVGGVGSLIEQSFQRLKP